MDLQDDLDNSLGSSLAKEAGMLGKPSVEEILSKHTKGWKRKPAVWELVVVNDNSDLVHALRPPRFHEQGMCLDGAWADIRQQAERPTWSGCTFSQWAVTSLEVCTMELLHMAILCKRCFGNHEEMPEGPDSSSSFPLVSTGL